MHIYPVISGYMCTNALFYGDIRVKMQFFPSSQAPAWEFIGIFNDKYNLKGSLTSIIQHVGIQLLLKLRHFYYPLCITKLELGNEIKHFRKEPNVAISSRKMSGGTRSVKRTSWPCYMPPGSGPQLKTFSHSLFTRHSSV